jgi:hypothetical protein
MYKSKNKIEEQQNAKEGFQVSTVAYCEYVQPLV